MSEKRKFIGLCGGLSPIGRQDNSEAVALLEREFGYYRTSSLDSIFRFSKTLGLLKEGMSEEEQLIVANKTCISGRTADENIWVNMALRNTPSDKTHILLDDIHFPEEAGIIHKFGGTIFELNIQGGTFVKPSFQSDVLLFGQTLKEVLDSFRTSLNNLRQSNAI
jgi:hypothetical protein